MISAVPVRVRPDGTVVAELDDSFMEATTVTIGANGALSFQHYTGLDRDERAVRLLPSRVLPALFRSSRSSRTRSSRLADGNSIRAQLSGGTLVNANISVDPTVHAGSDATGHAFLYTPAAVSPGSTISLGHVGLSESADGAVHQRRPDAFGQAAGGSHAAALARHRMVRRYGPGRLDQFSRRLPRFGSAGAVFVAGVNTGVANTLFTTGCTIADLVDSEADEARNHGDFVSGINHLTKALQDAGVISKDDRDRMHSAAAHASAP